MSASPPSPEASPPRRDQIQRQRFAHSFVLECIVTLGEALVFLQTFIKQPCSSIGLGSHCLAAVSARHPTMSEPWSFSEFVFRAKSADGDRASLGATPAARDEPTADDLAVDVRLPEDVVPLSWITIANIYQRASSLAHIACALRDLGPVTLEFLTSQKPMNIDLEGDLAYSFLEQLFVAAWKHTHLCAFADAFGETWPTPAEQRVLDRVFPYMLGTIALCGKRMFMYREAVHVPRPDGLGQLNIGGLELI